LHEYSRVYLRIEFSPAGLNYFDNAGSGDCQKGLQFTNDIGAVRDALLAAAEARMAGDASKDAEIDALVCEAYRGA
jgi:hypothetical protein